MAVMYVIHDPADRAVLETALLTPLPSYGFDRWVSSAAPDWTYEALQACAAAIVVVSSSSGASDAVRSEAKRWLQSGQPLIPIQIDGTDPERVAHGLGALPRIDAGDVKADALATRVRALLPVLLPPDRATADTPLRVDASTLIEWNEDVFSGYLEEALTRHDHNRGESLMVGLSLHLRQRPYPYPAGSARNDLEALRAQRQFQLMDHYGDLVLRSGTDDLDVRKLHAQSLIERGRFDEAEQLLEKILDDAPDDHKERYEALGLLGRSYKQRYVDSPTDPQASAWLANAFRKYDDVYREHPDKFWHGVNAATVMQRAVRDGLDWGNKSLARELALNVLNGLDSLRAKKPLAVWDCASRVEALIILGYFDSASAALDEYLTHPDMRPFEVGSTFRQFDQVLKLSTIEDGREIYDRLWRAVDRYRAGGVTGTPPQREQVSHPEVLPILIRVSDPKWRPAQQWSDLQISSRLGTIVSARATQPIIQELLKDQSVVAIEESRSVIDVTTLECERGLPFIGVTNEYTDSGGAFAEQGRHALIAFIDNGIDILHEAFTDENGTSRVVGIWDQRDPKGPPPEPFNYGRYYRADQIQAYVTKQEAPPSLGRNDAGELSVRGHGTHVASIAAGRKVGAFYRGIAPAARLLVVIAKSDGDIGYSIAHIDALAFIDAVATQLNAPVVVNVSKGMNAGAHDGKSALEVAFDEFSGGGRKAGRVVVKSAGNERTARGHAQFTAGSGDVHWTRHPQDWKFERIELWWDSANTLRFRLRSPGGAVSEYCSDATPDISGTMTPGGVYHLQLAKRHVDNGDSQLRIEVGDRLGGVQAGRWTLEIEAEDVPSEPTVHAWIARGGGKPSEFEDFANSDLTLTIPATSHSVIAVAAVRADPQSKLPQLGEFSSRGPTRDGRKKPDVAAPGVGVVAALAGTPSAAKEMSGTSMAAPHVAGAVALIMSRAVELERQWPAANQIRAMLTQKTKAFTGHHDVGRGYGVVDIAKLLEAVPSSFPRRTRE